MLRRLFQNLRSSNAAEQPLDTQQDNEAEEDKEEDQTTQTENLKEALLRLRVDGKRFQRHGYFETEINPSVCLRHSTYIASLVTWSVWALILAIGWWNITAVLKSPIPRAEIYNLQRAVTDVIRRQQQILPSSVQQKARNSISFNKIQDVLKASSAHSVPVVLLPLCADDKLSVPYFKSLVSSLQSNSSSSLFDPTLLPLTQAVSDFPKPISIPSEKLNQFCSADSPAANHDVSNDVLSLLQLIYSALNSTKKRPSRSAPYFILYYSSNAALPSAKLFLSDLPIALIAAPNLSSDSDFASWGSRQVLSTWFDQPSSIMAKSSTIRPKYVWRFLLVGNGRKRISWNFETNVMDRLLVPFLTSIRRLADVEISSHVVVDGDLYALAPDVDGYSKQSPVALTVADLSGFQSLAYRWMPSVVLSEPTNNPPEVLHYALYLQGAEEHGLLFTTPKNVPKKSFSISRWGAFVVPDREVSPDSKEAKIDYPTRRELEATVSMWMVHWRELLGLPGVDLLNRFKTEQKGRPVRLCPNSKLMKHNETSSLSCRASIDIGGKRDWDTIDIDVGIPQIHGITTWELNRIGRHALWSFLSGGASALTSLVEVLDDKPDLVVEPRLAERTSKAVSHLKLALNYANNDKALDLWSALNHSRVGFQLAKESLHDPTTTSATFFGVEFKAALYLPLTFPYLLALTVAWGREIRLRYQSRKLKQK